MAQGFEDNQGMGMQEYLKWLSAFDETTDPAARANVYNLASGVVASMVEINRNTDALVTGILGVDLEHKDRALRAMTEVLDPSLMETVEIDQSSGKPANVVWTDDAIRDIETQYWDAHPTIQVASQLLMMTNSHGWDREQVIRVADRLPYPPNTDHIVEPVLDGSAHKEAVANIIGDRNVTIVDTPGTPRSFQADKDAANLLDRTQAIERAGEAIWEATGHTHGGRRPDLFSPEES